MSETGARAWHADDGLVDRYLEGLLPFGVSASLETHLLHCEDCRALLTARVPSRVAARVEAAWAGVREGVEVPPLPWAVRVLRRLGVSESTAVVLATARSMSTAWTAATVVVLAFAALAVLTGSDAGRAAYLVIAPLVPVAGVVAAFGPTTDPLAETARATAYPAARLVLVRSAGVAATSVPFAVGMGLAVPGTVWLAFAWLAPALAFVLVVLAASTWVDPLVAGGVVALGWTVAVMEALRLGTPLVPVAGATQPAYLLLAAAGAVVLVLRLRRSNAPGGLT